MTLFVSCGYAWGLIDFSQRYNEEVIFKAIQLSWTFLLEYCYNFYNIHCDYRYIIYILFIGLGRLSYDCLSFMLLRCTWTIEECCKPYQRVCKTTGELPQNVVHSKQIHWWKYSTDNRSRFVNYAYNISFFVVEYTQRVISVQLSLET